MAALRVTLGVLALLLCAPGAHADRQAKVSRVREAVVRRINASTSVQSLGAYLYRLKDLSAPWSAKANHAQALIYNAVGFLGGAPPTLDGLWDYGKVTVMLPAAAARQHAFPSIMVKADNSGYGPGAKVGERGLYLGHGIGGVPYAQFTDPTVRAAVLAKLLAFFPGETIFSSR